MAPTSTPAHPARVPGSHAQRGIRAHALATLLGLFAACAQPSAGEPATQPASSPTAVASAAPGVVPAAADADLTPVDVAALPVLERPLSETRALDWLVDEVPDRAALYRSADGRALVLDNGLARRTWRLDPAAACVGLDDLSRGESLLRAVRPEARLVVDGVPLQVGGLGGQRNHAFLRTDQLDELHALEGALQLVGVSTGAPKERVAWKRVRHHAPHAVWPPRGVQLRLDYALPADATDDVTGDGGVADPSAATDARARLDALSDLRVSVHYELYDGLPVFTKWLEVHNGGAHTVTVDRLTVEELAVVEESNWVETRDGVTQPRPSRLHVETDFAFGGFTPENANRHVVHWRPDPLFTTQVNYQRVTPCLLAVEPTYGPAQDVAPGGTFASFHVFELLLDGGDRERRGLARRRMMRTLAPWVTENPIMHHMRTAEPEAVRRAIDDAAEVGFELVILSFGSGFDIESDDPAYIQQWKDMAAYAAERGVELGGYSLLSSRHIGDGHDVVSPPGERPTHGSCPALTSEWGQAYYRKLHAFFEETGFLLLEHDGPYPGDVDVTPRPPLQKGLDDSRWAQWRIASDFYAWCRARGISLNAPDHYYWNGTTKCGMGYRETNWSLPRDDQVLHTRQNVFDGTWDKTPSMGWMFVPLSEYHGGGAAATIEPLHEHRDHYARMLASNLGLGVQACYRGPRLFDSPETKALVAEQVAWFKRWRDILESDVIHGRRADGRDVDWMLHVNPRLDTPGMLVAFNPLAEPVTRRLRVDLHYTGVRGAAEVTVEGGERVRLETDADGHVTIPVEIGPRGMTWVVVRQG